MKHFFRTSAIPFVLIPSLIVSPVWAQTATAPGPESGTLELRVVQSSPMAKVLSVQVTDANGTAISDAAVAFRLPDTAPGVFTGGSHSAVAYTDASGIAHVEGIQWNATSGSVPVRITATKGNSHAGILFEQSMAPAAVIGPVSNPEPAVVSPAAMPAPALTSAIASPVAPPPPAITPAASPSVSRLFSAGRSAGSIPSVSITNDFRSTLPGSNSLHSAAYPSVSISSSPEGFSSHAGVKKWLIWGAVLAVGAGAGIALAGRKGGSSSSSTSSVTTTIGTPTISIGNP